MSTGGHAHLDSATGAVSIAEGGTAANTASGARTNLGLLFGTSTLSSGQLTVSAAITANSVIVVAIRDANPGAGGLTVGLETPVANRNVVGGTFLVRANVAAGTINVLDTSTFDYFVIG